MTVCLSFLLLSLLKWDKEDNSVLHIVGFNTVVIQLASLNLRLVRSMKLSSPIQLGPCSL